MPFLRVQVVIPADDNLPRNAAVNVWHFTTAGDPSAVEAALTTRLKGFYDGWAAYRGPIMNWQAAYTKGYNLNDPEPRPPLWEVPLGLNSTVGGTGLPQEVAMCLSFQAPKIAGAAQARRRGRVYLGPLATAASNGATCRPDTTFMNTLSAAATSFLALSDGTATWCVRSEAGGTPSQVPVDNGWIDNAFDTQRRRGAAPTSRLVFETL